MKKKVLVLLVVAILAITPAMAANSKGASEDGSVGIGLNLGTNTGLGLKFGMGKFDIFANIGLDMFSLGSDGLRLGGDVGVSYEVYDIDLGGKEWTPIGFSVRTGKGYTDESKPFTGLFNGNDHLITFAIHVFLHRQSCREYSSQGL